MPLGELVRLDHDAVPLENADSAAHDLKGDALHTLWGAEGMRLAEPHNTRVGK